MPEAKAWAVVDKSGINVRSIMPHRRGAIVSWLTTEKSCLLLNGDTDPYIEKCWLKYKGDADVVEVRVVANG